MGWGILQARNGLGECRDGLECPPSLGGCADGLGCPLSQEGAVSVWGRIGVSFKPGRSLEGMGVTGVSSKPGKGWEGREMDLG